MGDLRKEARNRPCTVRYNQVCTGDRETTVLAHVNGSGWALKSHDLHGAWACSACHDLYDGRSRHPLHRDPRVLRLHFLDGVLRTQQILIHEGKIDW